MPPSTILLRPCFRTGGASCLRRGVEKWDVATGVRILEARHPETRACKVFAVEKARTDDKPQGLGRGDRLLVATLGEGALRRPLYFCDDLSSL